MSNSTFLLFALLFFTNTNLNAQAVIYGTLSDEKGQINFPIILQDKTAGVFQQTQKDGTFAFRLEKGNYEFSYGGYRYLKDAFRVEVLNADSIRIDIQLQTTSKRNTYARIPKKELPISLLYEWQIKRFTPSNGKAFSPKKKQKMQLILGQHQQEAFGYIEMRDACHGANFKQFFQLENEQSFTIYDNYRPAFSTTEVLDCKPKYAAKKQVLITALYELKDDTIVTFEYLGKNKLQLEWEGHTLYLKRKK